MEIREKKVTKIMDRIGEAVANEDIGVFESGHGYEHHYRVAKDALRIARKDGVPVDENVLLVASCTHDFEQRGGVEPDELREFFLSDLELEEKFVDKVIDAVSNHSLDKIPTTVEGEVVWVSDKANYPDPERFKEVVRYIEKNYDSENRPEEINRFYEGLAEKWVRGTVEIPNHPLMKKYPESMRLFERRLKETLKYIRGDGQEVFKDWLVLYNQKHFVEIG
ncbi:MAG: hypothetical protein PVJ52_03505 [Candidatus Woesebacteria bacterium]|jgi:hypothetical protein